jgi:redox-sensing transcriptional repressor
MAQRPRRRIPEATVARLPVYLRSLLEVAETKTTTISSERLAEMAGVNAAKVRKDLSYLGSYGTRGVGYDVEYLLFQMSRELGLTQDWPVVIVGIGNLGAALANYGGFSDRGFPVAALVDADERKVGEQIGDLTVRHIDDLPEIVQTSRIAIGIIATPAAVAQDVADRMVAAGITSVLNFAPAVISVPAEASLRKVDLAVELQILSFYQQRRAGLLPPPPDEGADDERAAPAASAPPAPSREEPRSGTRSTTGPGRRSGTRSGSRTAAAAEAGTGPADDSPATPERTAPGDAGVLTASASGGPATD